MTYNMFSDYQCLERGVKAKDAKPNRSIPDRIDQYNLLEYINKGSKVLDLGCNRGFFGVYLSKHIGSYLGVDSDKKQIAFGLDKIKEEEIGNCILENKEFEGIEGKFDIILCLAFHSYVGMDMEDFSKCLFGMLDPNGYIFLEGHPPGYRGEPKKYFDPLVSYLTERLSIVDEKTVLDRGLRRPFRLLFNDKVGMVANIHIVNEEVEKRYFDNSGISNSHWGKEIEALTLLKNEEHFPQVLNVDETNRVIKMSYCGERLTKDNLPKDWENQCDEITGILKRKSIFHSDIYLKNILVKKGVIYLIDFGIWEKTHQEVRDIKDTIRTEIE